MANQPSIIPSAWAANNSTTETIPATTSESGKASWDQGFPVETSLPLSEGGIPPKYGDFNGILNVLSQFCLFAQAGGQFTWASTLSYSVGSIVVGSDGSIYRAVQATTNVNPVGDTSGKWERIVSKSDIDALEADIQTAMSDAANAVSNASAAQSAVTTLDANVVKLSGNQTVGGTKTFTSEPVVYTSSPNMTFKSSDMEQASDPSSTRYIYPIRFMDKNNAFLGCLEFVVGNDGARRARLATYKKDGTSVNLQCGFLANGTAYANAPNPASYSESGTSIATTSWVNNATSVVHTSGNQELTGNITINRSQPYLFCKDTSYTRGNGKPSSGAYSGVAWKDKANKDTARVIAEAYGNTGDKHFALLFQLYDPTSASSSNVRQILFNWYDNPIYAFEPGSTEQSIMLGRSSRKWYEIWCYQSSINSSSDERIKQAISSIPDDVLDAWGDVNWIQYKYNDAVKEKGLYKARLHNGLIAQRVDEAFKAHGLDAGKYGLFLYDQWDAEPEQKDENGNVTIPAQEAGDAYGLRYTEALCMEAAYQRRRADRAEARINTLERRLDEMEAVLASLMSPVGDETYAEPEQEQDAEQEGEE